MYLWSQMDQPSLLKLLEIAPRSQKKGGGAGELTVELCSSWCED